MKKLNLAIIGQGRSGKNIHGAFLRGSSNTFFNVRYVVETDEERRKVSESIYPNAEVISDYRDLFEKTDIDLVVNATPSDTHFSITKELLENKKNVLVEKPFSRSRYECDTLIRLAKENGVHLAVFQQSFMAPYYKKTLEVIDSGILGEIKQINVRFNGFSRRWDWQTLQKKCAGGIYNTGPHPIGLGLGYLGFDKNARVEYSSLGCALTSGDSDDYAKIILSAPEKPTVDIEVSSIDPFSDYTVKILGSRGCFKTTITNYKCVYIVDGENPERDVIESSLKDESGEPIYCSEKLIKHEESDSYSGSAFDVGTHDLYEELYYLISEGRPMSVTPEMAASIISVIETVHAQNPLPVKF